MNDPFDWRGGLLVRPRDPVTYWQDLIAVPGDCSLVNTDTIPIQQGSYSAIVFSASGVSLTDFYIKFRLPNGSVLTRKPSYRNIPPAVN